MDDLIAFLNARLDDDEQIARACGAVAWVANDVLGTVQVDPTVIRENKLTYGHLWCVAGTGDVGALGDAYRVHIARHDPARALRQVDAMRRILKLHGATRPQSGLPIAVCHECGDHFSGVAVYWPCGTLRLLALPYVDQPGFQESWRP
jgi:hypothetical protein